MRQRSTRRRTAEKRAATRPLLGVPHGRGVLTVPRRHLLPVVPLVALLIVASVALPLASHWWRNVLYPLAGVLLGCCKVVLEAMKRCTEQGSKGPHPPPTVPVLWSGTLEGTVWCLAACRLAMHVTLPMLKMPWRIVGTDGEATHWAVPTTCAAVLLWFEVQHHLMSTLKLCALLVVAACCAGVVAHPVHARGGHAGLGRWMPRHETAVRWLSSVSLLHCESTVVKCIAKFVQAASACVLLTREGVGRGDVADAASLVAKGVSSLLECGAQPSWLLLHAGAPRASSRMAAGVLQTVYSSVNLALALVR